MKTLKKLLVSIFLTVLMTGILPLKASGIQIGGYFGSWRSDDFGNYNCVDSSAYMCGTIYIRF
ncbi:MAG TPA: hypothetical protein DHU63_04065 [Candidatus Marinimicrobia bacterium]|nr:MAG: hypothetical protein AUJ47_09180 [Candidatus Marinimicrobia bacterium CG1_02_48_14]PJA54293.1 MAG: hypothetical protein CO167_04605 [Candidatus Marinimicrobia bacterium CG_4_9_14_3_um_filter_48_9]HCW75696.1 hypothetical protein [Candidatus Neomarinimicrobiota bacterium]